MATAHYSQLPQGGGGGDLYMYHHQLSTIHEDPYSYQSGASASQAMSNPYATPQMMLGEIQAAYSPDQNNYSRHISGGIPQQTYQVANVAPPPPAAHSRPPSYGSYDQHPQAEYSRRMPCMCSTPGMSCMSGMSGISSGPAKVSIPSVQVYKGGVPQHPPFTAAIPMTPMTTTYTGGVKCSGPPATPTMSHGNASSSRCTHALSCSDCRQLISSSSPSPPRRGEVRVTCGYQSSCADRNMSYNRPGTARVTLPPIDMQVKEENVARAFSHGSPCPW